MSIKHLNQLLEEELKTLTDNEIKRALEDKSDEAEKLIEEPDKLDKCLKEFEEKIKNVPMGEYLKYIPLAISMIKDYCNKSYKEIPIGTIIGLVSCILYFVVPTDLIPDVIPIVGFVDDAIILKYTIDLVKSDIDKYEEWKKANNGMS